MANIRLTIEDFERIAKDNDYEEIDFQKWIDYESNFLKKRIVNENIVYQHQDILNILHHLKGVYEGNPQPLHLKTSVNDALGVAHQNAMEERRREERGTVRLIDLMNAYDIYYMIRDTYKYLESTQITDYRR